MKPILAFDVGGTSIRAGIVKGSTVSDKQTASTPEGEKTLEEIGSLIDLMSADKKIQAICLALPGVIVDESRFTAQNLRLKDYPIRAELKRRLNGKKLPIYIGNDADCFALAEAIYGSGKGYSCVYVLTLGTGVGGGLVINNHLYTKLKNVSEPGRIIIVPNGIKSVKGNRGEFEEYCSARGILRIAKKHNLSLDSPLDVYNSARGGNQAAIDSWNEYGCYLGIGLNKVLHEIGAAKPKIIKPEIIILGGGLSNAWLYFSESMFKKLNELDSSNKVYIVQSHLKDAGILGASLLAKN